MSNALTQINKRTKQLQKLHPGKKRKTLQKQAGREYREGKLKKRRKPIARVGAVRKHKKATRKKRVAKPRVVTVVKYRTRKPAAKKVRRRVSGAVGKKQSLLPVLLLGGAGLAVVYMLTRSNQQQQIQAYQQQLAYRPNTNASNSAAQIIAYATAAGLTINAITNLINALNSSDDATVNNAAVDPNAYINQVLNNTQG